MNQRQAGWAGRVSWMSTLAVAVLCLWPGPALSGERCPSPTAPAGLPMPLDRIDDAIRCQVAVTVNRYTTLGAVGPVQAPVTREIYEYLLDHTWVLAALVNRLGMGNYEIVSKGHDQFWGNDGDGTEGLVRLAYRDEAARLYYIDGSHHGRIFPLVRAKAVVIMRITAAAPPAATPAVETTLQAYTRLDDPVLDGLVRLLRPLVAGAVTRKLTRSFEVLNQLCTRLAQDPDRVLESAPPAVFAEPGELEQLRTLVRGLPRQSTSVPPAAAAP